MKWNESGLRPPLCTYRLNWARTTSWGWWDDWDDIVLQTQDSKFEPWRSEAEHATSRSRRLPTILTFPRGWGRNIFCFFQAAETGNRTTNSGVKGSSANHYPRAPALQNRKAYDKIWYLGSLTKHKKTFVWSWQQKINCFLTYGLLINVTCVYIVWSVDNPHVQWSNIKCEVPMGTADCAWNTLAVRYTFMSGCVHVTSLLVTYI